MTEEPALIGLDWGTSSLRAFLMRDARVIETRQSADGIQSLAGGGAPAFERALGDITGDWLRRWPALPLMACGMVGSAQGWQEAPYVDCPADAGSIGAHASAIARAAGAPLLVAPGVIDRAGDSAPDVMRGEETQVLGALLRQGAGAADACILLPGTHSKWVTLQRGRIVDFRTYMTGEAFSVLKSHSILGRLMPPADAASTEADAAGFSRGLDAARTAGGELLHALFSVRTLGLTRQLPAEQLAGYLSGLLIGSELQAMLQRAPRDLPLLLVGDEILCQRYAQAARNMGRAVDAVLGNTAPDGLWALAGAAGLLRH